MPFWTVLKFYMEEASHGPNRTESTVEEADLLRRSTKKYKRHRDDKENEKSDMVMEDSGVDLTGVGNQKQSVNNIPEAISFKAALTNDQAHLYEGSDDEEELADEIPDPVVAKPWPSLDVSKEELQKLRRPWRKALIVKLLGRTVGYRVLRQRVEQAWKLRGNFQMVDLEEGYYLVRFATKEDYHPVLFDGPWTILGHYLTVQNWKPYFVPSREGISSTMVWVRFPQLPIEYFDKDFLLRLGNCIGKAVKVDVPSSKSERGKFARVCVQLDLTQSLISKVTVRSLDYCVEYEGLHSICFECGKYGHQKDTCPNLVVSKPHNSDMGGASGGASESAAGSSSNRSGDQPDLPVFGSWMIPKSRSRNRGAGAREMQSRGDANGNKNIQNSNEDLNHGPNLVNMTGSRFAALSVEDVIESEAQPTRLGPVSLIESSSKFHYRTRGAPSIAKASSQRKPAEPLNRKHVESGKAVSTARRSGKEKATFSATPGSIAPFNPSSFQDPREFPSLMQFRAGSSVGGGKNVQEKSSYCNISLRGCLGAYFSAFHF